MKLAKLLCVALVALFLTACQKSIEEKLMSPDVVQIFDYDELGHPFFTHHMLGKPFPFDGVEKKKASGWPVGNIKVIVTKASYFEPQLKILKEQGVLKDTYDYRIVWLPNIKGNLEDLVLKNDEVPEEMKETTRKFLVELEKSMGEFDSDEYMDLHDELSAWAKENMTSLERESIGQSIMKKGQSR